MTQRNGNRRALFCDAPGPVRRPWVVAAHLAAVLAAVGLIILRQDGTPAADSVWGEDGRVFLGDAYHRPLGDVLGEPYGGYMHLLPRLVAEAAAAVPPRSAAGVLAGAGALAAAVTALLTWSASRCVIRSEWIRAGLAASVVLLPIAGYEAMNTAANAHFYLLFAGFWALLWVPAGWPGRMAAAAIVVIAALSDPLAALLAPVAAARVIGRRGWRDHVVTLVWAAAVSWQLWVASTTELGFGGRAPFGDIARLFPLRVGAVALAGVEGANALWLRLGWGAAIAGGVSLLAVVALAWSLSREGGRAFVVLATLSSVSFFAVATYFRWSEAMLPDGGLPLFGSRHTVVPVLLVLSLLAVVVDRLRRTAVTLAVGALVLVTFAVDYRWVNPRSEGPGWRSALTDAGEQCEPGGERATVGHAPGGSLWSVSVPCDRLGEVVSPGRPAGPGSAADDE